MAYDSPRRRGSSWWRVASLELLWPRVTDDDESCRFVRAKLVAIAKQRPESS
jgi:hypothetical protein